MLRVTWVARSRARSGLASHPARGVSEASRPERPEDVELDLVLDAQAPRLVQGVPGLVTDGTAGGRGGAGVGQGRKPAAGRL